MGRRLFHFLFSFFFFLGGGGRCSKRVLVLCYAAICRYTWKWWGLVRNTTEALLTQKEICFLYNILKTNCLCWLTHAIHCPCSNHDDNTVKKSGDKVICTGHLENKLPLSLCKMGAVNGSNHIRQWESEMQKGMFFSGHLLVFWTSRTNNFSSRSPIRIIVFVLLSVFNTVHTSVPQMGSLKSVAGYL